jgi:hypothetical protein
MKVAGQSGNKADHCLGMKDSGTVETFILGMGGELKWSSLWEWIKEYNQNNKNFLK